jgi:hypothetical protein
LRGHEKIPSPKPLYKAGFHGRYLGVGGIGHREIVAGMREDFWR